MNITSITPNGDRWILAPNFFVILNLEREIKIHGDAATFIVILFSISTNTLHSFTVLNLSIRGNSARNSRKKKMTQAQCCE